MAGIRADIDLNINTSQAKRSIDKATNEINKIVGRISGKPVSFSVNDKSFTQPLGRINASANEFTKSLEASNARVIAFGASVAIIDGINNAFKSLVVEAVNFQKVLQDINVVLNLSNTELSKFGSGLFNAAQNTAQGLKIASEAAVEFARQGLATEEVLKRTNDALILTRLTGLKAADAVAGLTAAVNAFGQAGLSTTDIIDKLAAVDVSFAVSSEDLINALQRSGAVAIDAGVEFDKLIGIVAALQQTTARGGAVIGNSLKTIFTRLQRPESIKQLEEMGIVARNLSGALLPADKLLLNMAKSFDRLTQSQQSNVVQFSAGIFQANVFRAALRDLAKDNSLAAKASEVSANAAGEAAQKNEILNKTISALASQSGSKIQELAAAMGQLGLSPALGNALSFINDRMDEIRSSLGDGEDQGSVFAKGLVRGIGNIITGPGAVAFGAIFIKLFLNIAKFAQSSMKDVLGIVSQKDKLKQMEESILNILMEERFVQEGLNNLEGDRAAQEKFILGLLERQTSALREQQKLAQSLAGPLLKAGVQPNLTMGAAGGLNPDAIAKEKAGARAGGYAPGSVGTMKVSGMGDIVYNKAETVKKFPGMKQPAIMPPKQSKAGGVYQKAFQQKHGFDPYASGGFVPNFANLVGNKLIMDKARLSLFGGSMDIARATGANYKEIEKLFASGQPLRMSASLKDIIMSSDSSKQKISGKETLFEAFSALSGAGVHSIERMFNVRPPVPGRRGRGKLTQDQFAERKSLNLLNQELGGHQLTYDPKTKKGIQNYPVDIVGPGAHEVKSGKLSAANLISKSLRMASDRELSDWMATNKISGGKGLRKKNLTEAQKLASKLGIQGSGKSGEFFQSDADYWSMNQGLVPNFARGRKRDWGSSYDKLIQKYNDGKITSIKDMSDVFGLSQGGFTNYINEYTQIKKGMPYKSSGLRDSIGDQKFNKLKNIFNKVKNEAGDLSNVRLKGDLFEEILSTLSDQPFLKGKDALDFSKVQKRRIKMPSDIRKQIGLGSTVFYGDAESGGGHPPRLLRDKIIRELAESGDLDRLINQSGPIKLPGEKFVDIVARGKDGKPKTTLINNLQQVRSSRLTTKGGRSAIDNAINKKYGGRATSAQKQKEYERDLIYDYHVDDVDLNKLEVDGRTSLGKKMKQLLALQSKYNSQGLIPNFRYWKKHVQFAKGMDGGWGIKGDTSYLEDFINYLEKDGGNSPREIDKLKSQLSQVRTKRYKEIKSLGYPSMGREGAKYYANKSAIHDRKETLSLKGVFLKNLKDKIHKYNDIENSRLMSTGLVPNFANIVPFNNTVPFKKKTIRSKNLMHQEYLKAYSEGENQFKPGQTMLQFLSQFYDRKTLQDLRKYPQDYRILSGGFVPNFANPLNDAIAREKAAGIAASNIRVEQSDQLKGPGNPMGLAVTNTRDEPFGVQQGIKRARSLGIDPKVHGASQGLIPNFAQDDASIDQLNASLAKSIKSGNNLAQSQQEQKRSIESNTNQINENTDAGGQQTRANVDGLAKLFYLQSSISMASGFLQEFAEQGTGATKTLANFGLGLSDAMSVFITAREIGDQLSSFAGIDPDKQVGIGSIVNKIANRGDQASGSGAIKGLGKLSSLGKTISRTTGFFMNLGKGLLRFAPLIGQVATAFTVVNEAFKAFNLGEVFGLGKNAGIMDFFATASERAAKKIENLSKSSESLQAALDALGNQSINNQKVNELENLGALRTQKQEVELFNLKMKDLDLQVKTQKAMSQLLDENIVGTSVADKFNKTLGDSKTTVEEQSNIVRKLLKLQKQRIAIEEGSKNFADIIERKLDKLTLNRQDTKFLEQASQFRGAQTGMALSGVLSGNEDADPKERLRILDENIRAIGDVGSLNLSQIMKEGASGVFEKLSTSLQGTEDFGGALIASAIGDFIGTIDEAEDNFSGLTGDEAKAAKKGIQALLKQLEKQKSNLQKAAAGEAIVDGGKDVRKAYIKIIAAYKNQEQEIAHQNKLLNIANKINREIQSSQLSILNEYKGISNQQKINEQHLIDISKIEEDYKNKLLSANESHVNSIQKVAENFINMERLGADFTKENGKALEAVQSLKNTLNKNVTDADIANIGETLGKALSPSEASQINSFFQKVSTTVESINDNGLIINELMKEYGDVTDGTVRSAIMIALYKRQIANLEQEELETLKTSLKSRRRSGEIADEQLDAERKGLENSKAQNLIKEKTYEGAVKLLEIFRQQGAVSKSAVENMKGENATLIAINHLQKDRLSELLKSGELDSKAYETQLEKNRSEAESAILSLKQLQAQENIFSKSKEIEMIQNAKLQSEVLTAQGSAREAQSREEYFKYAESRLNLVNKQLSAEQSNARTTMRENVTKLKLLQSTDRLEKELEVQLEEELSSTQSSAMIASQKELMLSANRKMLDQLNRASELEKTANKLAEARNKVLAASIGKRPLSASVEADIIGERAGSIRGTRDLAMKSSITGSPEDALAFAQALEQTNKELQTGTEAFDRLRVRMAEMQVSAGNLGADLVDIGIDNARSGLKQLFMDIGTGAKSAKEAWKDFALGMANELLDRIMTHNIDRIISDLTYAFTGEDGSSDAEKIAGSNNHLVEANYKLESALNRLTDNLGLLQQEVGVDIAGRPVPGSVEGVAPNLISGTPSETAQDKTLQELINEAAKTGPTLQELIDKENEKSPPPQMPIEQPKVQMLNEPVQSGELKLLGVEYFNQKTQEAADKYAHLNPLLAEMQSLLNSTTSSVQTLGVDAQGASAGLREIITEARNRTVTVPGPGPVQKFAKGGFVKGPPGEDRVPAMLTAGEFVLPKEQADLFKKDGGIIQHFSDGTNREGAKRSRLQAGLEGIARGVVMHETARAVAKSFSDGSDQNREPQFDMNKFKQLDLGSTVSLSKRDPRLSAKFIATNPVMEDYRSHLIKLAEYKVKQKNKKVAEKMQSTAAIVGAATSFITAEFVSAAKDVGGQIWEKGKNIALGQTGLGEYSEQWQAAKKAGIDVNYSDVAKSIETKQPLEYQGKTFFPETASESMTSFKSGAPAGSEMNTVWHQLEGSPNTEKNKRALSNQSLGDQLAFKIKNDKSMLYSPTRPKKMMSGGMVPAMLTAGEAVIPSAVARQIGYNNLNDMNRTGQLPTVQGPGGIDNVGPVGLNEGDFVIKRSSTNSLLRNNSRMMQFAMQNPGGFRKAATGYYQGGIVGTPTAPGFTPQSSGGDQVAAQTGSGLSPILQNNQISSQDQGQTASRGNTTNNINVNVTIDSTGSEQVSADSSQGGSSYEQEQELALKIKTSVLEVIRQEKRIGGELSQ